jgi:hypothetical protein
MYGSPREIQIHPAKGTIMRRNHPLSSVGLAASATIASVALTVATPAAANAATGLTLSASSGPVGSVIQISGNAGPGCIPGKTWFGFQFVRSLNSGPVVEMTPPVAPDGSWNARFEIPSFLAGSATRGSGAATTPGQYLISAPTACSATTREPMVTATFTVTPGVTPSATSNAYVGIAASPTGGYWLAQADGAVTGFGGAPSLGSLTSLGVRPVAPIVGIAATPDGEGYWLAGSDGGVFAFGDARGFGSLPGLGVHPSAPIVGIAPTSDGKGYWLVGSDGGVFTFGDAIFAGTPGDSIETFNAIGAIGAGGYALSGSYHAAVFTFPGTKPIGGFVGTPVASTLTGAAVDKNGGIWQVGLDGGVMAWGGAPFLGSLPSLRIPPNAPITGIAATPDGKGYWLLGADGGVFSFGDAHFHGSGA